jgi:alpha-1,6-mannosyltransferase
MKLYNHMDTTVVATDRMASILAGVGIERLRKIPLGADHTVFYPRHSGPCIRAELGIDDQAKLLLYVGRLAREKNIRSLLQMMPMLESEHDRYHLCLVGDGEQRDLVRQHCADRNDITLLPYASSEDRLAELYSAADLFVHAGTAETFGLVSVEAQSCGTRVLAIEGGGLDETLRGEQPLIMARDSSSESLAHAITCAILLGENAVDRKTRRDRMVRHFSSQRTYEQLIALYGRLSEKRHIPSAALQTERPAHALYHPVLHTS